MQKRMLVSLVLLASLVVQFSSPAVILPPPIKKVTLTWEYPDGSPDIVFNVYGSSDLSLPLAEWPLITTVVETSCSIPMEGESFFFVVAASNIVTGLESSYSLEEMPLE
ncbi:MAG: hypothetical protein H7Y43_14470 [Akkermansiaceae bacterium]|nr:hypothetical protein [Verrucomicrobiales bacterium]